MLKYFSFRTQVIFLIAVITVGIYTLILIGDSSKKHGPVFTEDGIIINYSDNKPYTGKVTDTVSNQIISYDVIDGIKNGEFTIAHLNGSKIVVGEIINNKNEGKWSYFYPNGKLESEGYFKNDDVVDKWTWFYPNGTKMEEGKYSDGKREGMWKLYNNDGSLKSTVLFQDGKVITSSSVKSPAAS
jgi:antitoxin component YwqK of YwqJK toxin-antitoxin module